MEDKYVQIEGHPGLVRDVSSMAVICTDSRKLQEAKERKRIVMGKDERLNFLENEFKEIKTEIKDLKELILKVLERRD